MNGLHEVSSNGVARRRGFGVRPNPAMQLGQRFMDRKNREAPGTECRDVVSRPNTEVNSTPEENSWNAGLCLFWKEERATAEAWERRCQAASIATGSSDDAVAHTSADKTNPPVQDSYRADADAWMRMRSKALSIKAAEEELDRFSDAHSEKLPDKASRIFLESSIATGSPDDAVTHTSPDKTNPRVRDSYRTDVDAWMRSKALFELFDEAEEEELDRFFNDPLEKSPDEASRIFREKLNEVNACFRINEAARGKENVI